MRAAVRCLLLSISIGCSPQTREPEVVAVPRGERVDERPRTPRQLQDRQRGKPYTPAVVGGNAPALDVEKWFQGESGYSDAPSTLLIFCEVWGPECKRVLPELAAKESWYASAGVRIIGLTRVTKSATDEDVRAFLRRHEIKFPFAKEREAAISRELGLTRTGIALVIQHEKIVWAGLLADLSESPLPTQ